MTKKNFKGGLDSLLSGGTSKEPEKTKEPKEEAEKPAVPAKRGRPKTSHRAIEKSSQEGCKEAETRATFIVSEADLEKLKALAYWERLQIKDVVGVALRDYVERYEKKAGALKPIPKR